MKNKILHLFIIIFLFQISVMAQSLEKHLWQDRIILLFAHDFQSSDLQKQLNLFEKELDGLKERKLVVYQITPSGIKKDGNNLFENNLKLQLTKTYQSKNNTFTFILIGLDGGKKMRSTKVVSSKDLFGKIDQMPMRKWEIKN